MAPVVDSSSFFVEIWLNGLYFSLALSTVHLIFTSKRISGRRKIWQLGMVVVPYACSTIHMITIWRLPWAAINDNELPTATDVLGSLMHPPVWQTGLSQTVFALNICLADYIVIWRCWTVWGRQWKVVVLPILCSVTGAVIAGIIIADQVLANSSNDSIFMTQKTAQFITFSTVFFSLSISTSLMTALLIAARIIDVQRTTGKAGVGDSSTYNSIIEVVVESAVTYSVTLLAFIIILTRHLTPTSQFFSEDIHTQIAGMAPMMILYRIASKQARPDVEWENTAVMSSLRFTQGIHHTPREESEQSNGIGEEDIVIIGGGSSKSTSRGGIFSSV